MAAKDSLTPNFFLIGAGKSATTSIAAQIGQHPEIFVSAIKEPHYFSINHGRGEAWYLDLFRNAGDARMRGEASVTYSQVTRWPGVAKRIYDRFGPDCLFIYVMRHPVHALASHFFHDQSRGHIPLEARIQDHISPDSAYVDARRYNMQIEEYLRYFDRKNFLFLTYEDYTRDPRAVLSSIYRFFGVDETFVPADMAPKNVSAGQLRRPKWYRLLKSLRRRYDWLRPPALLRTVAQDASARGSRPVETPTLSADDERRIWALVADDVTALSATVGRDMMAFWNAPSPAA